MNELEKYEKDCSEILSKISSATEAAWNEIVEYSRKQNAASDEDARHRNEAPCRVCKKTDYIIKYREVVGTIKGRTSGYFSIFGGSISGYVDGETHTNPILSCRGCGNEKLVALSKYKSSSDYLEDKLPAIFPTIDSFAQANEWLKSKGLEVAKKLAKDHLIFANDYHELDEFTDEEVMKTGLTFKYPFPPKPIFYSLRKFFS